MADMVSCLYVYPWQGVVFLENNTFVNNSAITLNRVLVGSASVMQISGLYTVVVSISNIYFQNIAEYAAVIGVFYGVFTDINSTFQSKKKRIFIKLVNLFYLENSARSFTLVMLFAQGISSISNSLFVENYAENEGLIKLLIYLFSIYFCLSGMMGVTESSILNIIDCHFNVFI